MENADHILDAPQMETARLQYAGFWIRTGAYLIDAVILTIINLVIGLLMMGAELWGSLINIIIGLVYVCYMESSEHQATLGKMAVGIRVGDQNGNQISFANALGRYFAKIISAVLLCIGFMMVGWDEKNQGLHDKLADTYVFYVK